MTRRTQPEITAETRFVTGAQAIQSTRWPVGRDTFYGMVRNKLIPRYVPYEGARPVFKVEDIDQVFSIQSGDQSGGQSEPQKQK
jgi:hypothetical protein